MNNYVMFTVCNVAYLPKALALGKSVLEQTGIKLKIFIIDKKRKLPFFIEFSELYWIEDLNIQNFYHLAFKYDITEFSTSVKPLLALNLLDSYEKVIFLDPDTFLYNNLDGVLSDLDDYSIVLTPHYMSPYPAGDISMLRFGSFNLGFFAVNNSIESLKFLKWWDERCQDYCYFETQFGLSTDQKWISIANCFFSSIKVNVDPSLNVSFWNLHERKISHTEDSFFVNGHPLVLFHFSSFNSRNPKLLTTRPILLPNLINKSTELLSSAYAIRLKEFDSYVTDTRYAYDYLDDGSYISPTLRRAYAACYNELVSINNPFEFNGKIKRFIKVNYLHTFSTPYKSLGFDDKNNSKLAFTLINMSLRFILFVIGPNKFMNLSRLFVYLSSYRINRDLWKV